MNVFEDVDGAELLTKLCFAFCTEYSVLNINTIVWKAILLFYKVQQEYIFDLTLVVFLITSLIGTLSIEVIREKAATYSLQDMILFKRDWFKWFPLNFSEQLFWRISSGNCFCIYRIYFAFAYTEDTHFTFSKSTIEKLEKGVKGVQC